MTSVQSPELDPANNRAVAAVAASGIRHEVRTHGKASSLAEAAALRRVRPRQIVKSMIVKDGTGEYHVVLVPGDRVISWPKLRAVLGVNKATMPSADEAKAVTGFARGTITPFGTLTPLDIVADALVEPGPITVGGGAYSVGIYLDGDDLLAHFGAERVDITEPDPAFVEAAAEA